MMKNILYHCVFALLCVTLLAGVAACSDDEEAAPFITLGETTATLPAAAGSVEVPLTTNVEVSVAVGDASWCAATLADGKLVVSAAANAAASPREASIVVSAGGSAATPATLRLTQQGSERPALSVQLAEGDEEIVFGNGGGSYTVKVEATQGWTAECEASWVTLSTDETAGTFTVQTIANQTISVLADSIMVYSGTDENMTSVSIPVSQNCVSDAMVMTLRAAADNENVVALPFNKDNGVVNCVVDWGDGRMQHVCYSYPQHEYDEAGDYTVRIYGRVDGFTANNDNYFGTPFRNAVIAVNHWGNIQLKSLKYGFDGCSNLSHLAAPDDDSFSQLTTIYSAFDDCVSLTSLPEGMFANAPKLTEAYEAFSSCTGLTAVPARLLAGCAKLTRAARLFWGCSGITSVGDGVLSGCAALKDVGTMFYNTQLSTLPGGFFADCVSLTTVNFLFSGWKNLTAVPEGLFANSPKITSVYGMFEDCVSLASIPADFFRQFPKVTNMGNLFAGCTALTTVPEGLFADNVLVTNVSKMFAGCAALTSLPTSLLDTNVKISNVNSFCKGCTALEGESPYTVVDGVKVHLYERTKEGGFADIAARESNYKQCFIGCTKLSDYDTLAADYPLWVEPDEE